MLPPIERRQPHNLLLSLQSQITYQSFSKSMAALFPFWVRRLGSVGGWLRINGTAHCAVTLHCCLIAFLYQQPTFLIAKVSSPTAAAAPEGTAREPKTSASTSSTPRSPGQIDSLVVPPRGESESVRCCLVYCCVLY